MKKAFVLGGTVPHIELITKLKAKGYYVYLVDYTKNPPAKTVADEHLEASTLDADKVLKLAQQYGADLVISACIDQANSTACYVGEKLGLAIPYSYETSLEVTRKGLMKQKFVDNGIPTSDFYLIAKDAERVIRKQFPFVIKPTDANSSKGVFKIYSEEEFCGKIEESMRISREGCVIVEDYVEGTEIQVDCVAIDGKAHVLMTRDKVSLIQDGKELQVSGFTIPGNICERYYDELRSIAQKIVDAFGLTNTPFFYQAICNKSGVFVLEFAPRIAGGTTYDMVRKYCGFDLINAAVASFTNQPICNEIKVSTSKITLKFLYMKPGVFDHIEGLKEVALNGLVDEFFPFVVKGKEIGESMNSGNRIGAIMSKGDSYETSESKLNKAMNQLRVIDSASLDRSFWR